ncbi:MAG: SUF system Fe-S cluster assembly protein [Terriglobia bacterium]
MINNDATAASAADQTSPTGSDEPRLTIAESFQLQDRVVDVLRTCYDPEIPVNIYELGLVYEVKVERSGAAYIRMTLTAPTCPVAGTLPPEVEAKVKELPGISSAKVEVVWEPPWDMSKMSEAARLQLGMW